jgi:menaquinol-cytochrome c reductase iron-sulfur subunit
MDHFRATIVASPMLHPNRDARRGVLKLAAKLIGVAIGGLVAIPAVRFLFHPLRQPVASPDSETIRVASRRELNTRRPVRVSVFGELHDAWTRADRIKLGTAWLVQSPEGNVRAFSAECPHQGCQIDWNDDARRFDCPCHKSGFAEDGRCLFGPAPRGMDELEVALTDDSIRIRYQRFRARLKEKEPLG